MGYISYSIGMYGVNRVIHENIMVAYRVTWKELRHVFETSLIKVFTSNVKICAVYIYHVYCL